MVISRRSKSLSNQQTDGHHLEKNKKPKWSEKTDQKSDSKKTKITLTCYLNPVLLLFNE